MAWFDGNADGIITPWDTYRGFYALGFGVILSFIALNIIHGPLGLVFSYPTIPVRGNRLIDWLPDLRMRIWVANINRCKHGSDSESYRRNGHFNTERFDHLFEAYSSKPERDGLSAADIYAIVYERRNLFDLFGWFAMAFELYSSYWLLWPEDGFLKKDDLLGIYDGSIFPVIAANRRKRGALKSKKNVT